MTGITRTALLVFWGMGLSLFILMDAMKGQLSMRTIAVRLLWPLFMVAVAVSELEKWAYRERKDE